ncbi:AMP-binding protein, partial [Nonomuraea sp. NPDC055795]
MHWTDEEAARYRAAGYWSGISFGDLLRELAGRHGERTALVSPSARWSFRELDERADRLAAGLRERGVGPGDRVVVQLPNVPQFHQVCFALYRLGAWPVFALPGHRSAEISHFC